MNLSTCHEFFPFLILILILSGCLWSLQLIPTDDMTLIFDKDTFQKALSISIIHVRYLFLSDTKRPDVVEAKAGDESSEPMWELIWMEWPDETSTMFSSAMHQIEERQQHGSTQFLSYRGMPRIIYHSDESWKPMKFALHTTKSTVTKLLAHLALSLHDFCYYQSLTSSALFSHRFPALVELACHLGEIYGVPEFGGLTIPSTDLSVQMPVLKRLHLVSGNSSETTMKPILLTKGLAASLSFVRIPIVDNPLWVFSALARDEVNSWVLQSGLCILMPHNFLPRNRLFNGCSEADVVRISLSPQGSIRHLEHALGRMDASGSSVILSAALGNLSITNNDEQDKELNRPKRVVPKPNCNMTSSWQYFRPAFKMIIHDTYMVKKDGDYDVHRSHNEWLAQMDGGAGCWADSGRPLSMYIH
jgi:hypothetical protein